jgi:hypothetical protein
MAMKEQGLLLDSEHSVTRLQRLNLTDSQQGDVITYEPGQILRAARLLRSREDRPQDVLHPIVTGHYEPASKG